MAWGRAEQNFYNRLAIRMGFAREAAEIQDLFLARRHREAAAAVPMELIDATALIGPRDRIARPSAPVCRRRRDDAHASPPSPPRAEDRVETLRVMAELVAETGLGD